MHEGRGAGLPVAGIKEKTFSNDMQDCSKNEERIESVWSTAQHILRARKSLLRNYETRFFLYFSLGSGILWNECRQMAMECGMDMDTLARRLD